MKQSKEQVWYQLRLFDHVDIRPIEFAMPLLAKAFSQSILFGERIKAEDVKFFWNFWMSD